MSFLKSLAQISFIGLLVASCAPPSPAGSQDSVGAVMKCRSVDYGQHVFYFACRDVDFANALALFKRSHPELVITAMAGNGTGNRGRDRGYFVSAEPRSSMSKETAP